MHRSGGKKIEKELTVNETRGPGRSLHHEFDQSCPERSVGLGETSEKMRHRMTQNTKSMKQIFGVGVVTRQHSHVAEKKQVGEGSKRKPEEVKEVCGYEVL